MKEKNIVAVNMNEGQKPCELSDAYLAILRDPSLCGQEGSGREVESDSCLCPPVPEYGEVPDYTTNGLNNRAQAFSWTGMEEGDGLADEGESRDASEGKDAKDASSSDKAPGCIDPAIDAAREARDAARPDSVTVEFGTAGVSVSGTWDTSDKSDSSASESTANDK